MLEPYIFAGGRIIRLTGHVLIRMEQRHAEESWIVQVLENPVAIIDDERKESINYYGFISGRRSLFKVVVSKLDDRPIVTVYFDTPATRRYERGVL